MQPAGGMPVHWISAPAGTLKLLQIGTVMGGGFCALGLAFGLALDFGFGLVFGLALAFGLVFVFGLGFVLVFGFDFPFAFLFAMLALLSNLQRPWALLSATDTGTVPGQR